MVTLVAFWCDDKALAVRMKIYRLHNSAKISDKDTLLARAAINSNKTVTKALLLYYGSHIKSIIL